jgi:cell division protein FtsL
MKKKKIALWLIGAVFVAATGFYFFGRQGVYYQHRQLQRKTAEIETDRRTIDSLQSEIRRLTRDSAFVERLAREKLGMARENEKVYKFIEKRK